MAAKKRRRPTVKTNQGTLKPVTIRKPARPVYEGFKPQEIAAGKPLGFVKISGIDATAAALPSIPAGVNKVLLQAETANVRFRDDGTDPTTTVGMLLIAGQQPIEYEGRLNRIKFIAVSAGGTVNVSYMGGYV